jgi:hypothetical protein
VPATDALNVHVPAARPTTYRGDVLDTVHVDVVSDVYVTGPGGDTTGALMATFWPTRKAGEKDQDIVRGAGPIRTVWDFATWPAASRMTIRR